VTNSCPRSGMLASQSSSEPSIAKQLIWGGECCLTTPSKHAVLSPGSRMADFGQDAGGMVDPDDEDEDEWSPPPTANTENEADAGAVAGLASDARSM